jgi:dTDP-4-amino-4,6-dideoxygalactose transaminase
MQPKYYHRMIGGNFRLDALQAAVLRVKAPHLAAWTEARRRNADRYRALFAEVDTAHAIGLPVEQPGNYHIYNQFVIRVPDRDGLRAHLGEKSIGTEVYYPVPFHAQESFASLGYKAGDFPHAERAAAESLALPIYGELTDDQLRAVVESITDYYAS